MNDINDRNDRNGTGWLAALVATIGIAATSSGAAAEIAAGKTAMVAVAKFDYADTSGEARDQTAAHAERLAVFRDRLEAELVEAGSLDKVTLACMTGAASGCSLAALRAEPLLGEAKRAGADYLVYGGIHKMSTLVGFGRVDVLDVAKNRVVFDRVITFRGDTDDAFRRAAAFVATDIRRTLTGDPSAAADAGKDETRGVR
ncbi:DUF2380 domain-containing protein [Jiella sonneratiae]|uniref:DUF2380 domain-containing protein n=1 Tax=Jiella sonneratiae TaxID=2816856 RepID=A0ABS3J2P1_9HYPH|nr:DUF2380 domain-containing protein [Jiella sonneratiae]MBO0903930.1 DUF2380 domain-containing protein [Jiella sonneratiae]